MGERSFFLKEWRIVRGYTQQQLADEIQVTKSYVSDMDDLEENGPSMSVCSEGYMAVLDPHADNGLDMSLTIDHQPETNKFLAAATQINQASKVRKKGVGSAALALRV